MLYQFLDYLFEALHLAVIGFNLFGWAWRRTRLLNLITLTITFLSWFGLGVIYGLGYCFLTDWHWQIKHSIGVAGLPNSYIKYLFDRATGLSFDPNAIDILTFVSFFSALGISIYLNYRDLKKSRTQG